MEWYTPPEIFAALAMPFDLDPCSPGAMIVPWIPARTHYTEMDDGLTQPWRGRIWMNPPYGRGLERWLQRFCEHQHGVALVFARTDARWFHTFALQADALCFTRGRIRFVSPTRRNTAASGVGCGSVFLAYGNECVESLRCSDLGLLIDLRVQRERELHPRRGAGTTPEPSAPGAAGI